MLKKNRVIIWLYDNIEMRIEGKIVVRKFSRIVIASVDDTSV